MHKKDAPFTEHDIPALTGYVAIVTGGNAGIGYETVKQLALHNARIFIAGRSKERVDRAITELQQSSLGRPLDLHFLQIDLQDLSSVKAAATDFMRRETRLDILVNNAGVMSVPFSLTKDGFESHWQVNYLAPFILTLSLMPLLISTASQCGVQDRVRVVNVSSDLALLPGMKHMQLDDVNLRNAKGMTELLQRYAHSKQGSIRHAKELNDRYGSQGVTAYSLHPGVIRSNLQNADPTLLGMFTRITVGLTSRTTPLGGALNSLFCATSPSAPARGQGKYFLPVGKVSGNGRVDGWLGDREGNAELWTWSERAMERVN